MSDLLFDTPWWLPTTLILVGAILLVSGNRRQKAAVRNAGAGLIALALAVMLISYLVETDKEKCLRQTRETVKAVQSGDWARLSALLDSNASLDVTSTTIFSNRDDLVAGAQEAASRYGLKSVTILSIQARQTQSVVMVDFDALTVQTETMDRPLPSSWEFEWLRRGAAWQLDRITCLKVDDLNLNQTQNLLPH
jgi:hypothetical protein